MRAADRIVDILLETPEEVRMLRQYGQALRDAGPVNASNPGGAKKHRQAGLQSADEERRKRMQALYKELGLDID